MHIFKVMAWFEEFQRKGVVETCFLEFPGILLQRNKLAQNKTLRKDTRNQNCSIRKSHRTHVSDYKAPTSQCKYPWKPPLKGKSIQTLIRLLCFEIEFDVKFELHDLILSFPLSALQPLFPMNTTRRIHEGKHGNADMLWNAF